MRLLGPPRISRDGQPVAPDTRKAVALLAYLAMAGRPVARDEAVALLWPDADQSRGRAALRRTLSTLNSALDGHGLVVEGDTIALDASALWVDVHEFRHMIAAGSPADAVELYTGSFLAGFGLRDSVEFDQWQLGTTEQLRREVSSALERVTRSLASSDVDAAIATARRWVELDPLQEAAHRSLIELHSRKGDRAAAVRQYRDCVALLESELGLRPGAETTEAYEAAHRTQTSDSRLQDLMGDLLTLQGRYTEALRSYESAVGLGSRDARRRIADVRQRLGDFEGAERMYAEVLDALSTSQAAERAHVLADRSLNAHRRGDAGLAEDFAAQALVEAEAAGDDRGLAQAHNIAGILASHRGDAVEARMHLERSLELAEQQDDPVATAAALNNLALALRSTEIELALRLAQRALDLCARVGDRHREAAMHSNLADLLRAAGRTDEAMGHLRLSAAIFADVGEPGETDGELRPEIWKLVEW